jgi:hypothetical protein
MMSRLEYYQRPLVAFDAEDKDHRAYFHEFLITKTWGKCPVRFICPDEHGPEGLVGIVMRQLINFYVRQEFGDTPQTENIPIKAHVPRRPKSVELDMRLMAQRAAEEV